MYDRSIPIRLNCTRRRRIGYPLVLMPPFGDCLLATASAPGSPAATECVASSVDLDPGSGGRHQVPPIGSLRESPEAVSGGHPQAEAR